MNQLFGLQHRGDSLFVYLFAIIKQKCRILFASIKQISYLCP